MVTMRPSGSLEVEKKVIACPTRGDAGEYAIEAFCRLVGYDLDLTLGVREAECLSLRRRWGKDAVRHS